MSSRRMKLPAAAHPTRVLSFRNRCTRRAVLRQVATTFSSLRLFSGVVSFWLFNFRSSLLQRGGSQHPSFCIRGLCSARWISCDSGKPLFRSLCLSLYHVSTKVFWFVHQWYFTSAFSCCFFERLNVDGSRSLLGSSVRRLEHYSGGGDVRLSPSSFYCFAMSSLSWPEFLGFKVIGEIDDGGKLETREGFPAAST